MPARALQCFGKLQQQGLGPTVIGAKGRTLQLWVRSASPDGGRLAVLKNAFQSHVPCFFLHVAGMAENVFPASESPVSQFGLNRLSDSTELADPVRWADLGGCQLVPAYPRGVRCELRT